ncbi:thiamine ABC transporter substrate-binding protein [Jannaschia seohaensis]|uniref:Thiamine transport system substrate-binding protein n=1 Tax=Jannaschia seohaensis TaxID=475081 RepID=A0A2Y9C3K2_9RHOB|nr:thiamine ABC transporter substrate binding subunit [Jannaschia seohaensis]PWJ21685.1 thiamine transport system substrate-binding protein [Jannaschia seohaensis]SSA37963.1 thiamine transport system substrate-binding protein [Jannaschia seohaensis]
MRLTIATGLTLIASAAAAEPLTVYAPDYFASEWGPGPAIKAAFEAECDCEIEYVTGDLLPRLRLEGERTTADVVIGLNADDAERARQTGLFAPHGVEIEGLTMPIEWTDETFVPFNWSHTAFVYDTTRLAEAPESFQALLDAPDDLALVVQDPRTSVSGLALALWIQKVFGDEAENAWAALAPKIVTVTRGWSESYGMFTEGEADMVLSYTTSPAYHIIAEGDDTKKAAIFEEGHYVLVETAGQIAGSDQPELAQAFLDFILTEDFQSIIPEGNWSLPAKLDPAKMPEGFAQLDMPATALIYGSGDAETLRDKAVAAFEAGLGR